MRWLNAVPQNGSHSRRGTCVSQRQASNTPRRPYDAGCSSSNIVANLGRRIPSLQRKERRQQSTGQIGFDYLLRSMVSMTKDPDFSDSSESSFSMILPLFLSPPLEIVIFLDIRSVYPSAPEPSSSPPLSAPPLRSDPVPDSLALSVTGSSSSIR